MENNEQKAVAEQEQGTVAKLFRWFFIVGGMGLLCFTVFKAFMRKIGG